MVDFTPLFRTAIGFDRLTALLENASEVASPGFPPYNIESVSPDAYRLTLAVAGFGPDELDVTAQEGVLIITGKPAKGGAEPKYLHRGIAGRAFERKFSLADHLVVEGADLKHGMLHVDLRRVVPEALKPRRIAIGGDLPRVEARAAD